MDERVMYTDTVLAGVSVLSIRSTMQGEAAVEDLPVLKPSWRLKVIPRADGSGADVMQLIDGGVAATDVTVHVCRAGDGVVQFNPSPIYDLTGLAPLEYYGAHYVGDGFHGRLRHDRPRFPARHGAVIRDAGRHGHGTTPR